MEERDDFTNKEFQSMLNEQASVDKLSAKEPIKVETTRSMAQLDETLANKEPAVNTLNSNALLDFFKATIPSKGTDEKKTNDNFDGRFFF